MRYLDDFKCINEKCEELEKTVERFYRRTEPQTCEHCGEEMQKCISGLKSKHISWSTWAI